MVWLIYTKFTPIQRLIGKKHLDTHLSIGVFYVWKLG